MEYQSNPAKLNPRCWNCNKPMDKELRKLTVFCCERCEYEYNRTEQGSSLTPVIAILTAFTVAAVLIAQSGLLHTICARLAEVR